MCGLDTQESILATKVSNLRNKSHLYSKMTTCVSNCPNFIATGVPIGLYGQTNGRTSRKQYAPHFFKGWGIISMFICHSNILQFYVNGAWLLSVSRTKKIQGIILPDITAAEKCTLFLDSN